jgi:hypothetical protein
MRSVATCPAYRAYLLPDQIADHRVGWFPYSGLVFAEGSLAGDQLCPPAEIRPRAKALVEELKKVGVPVDGFSSSEIRRLDVAVDLGLSSSMAGLALLECIGGVSPAKKKVVTYRVGHTVETVVIKSHAGNSQARVYDKGLEKDDGAQRARRLRFEAQWRFAKGSRLEPDELTTDLLRERFQQRFQGLYDSGNGFELGGAAAIADRLAKEVADGRLAPSRARSIAGYLLLRAAGASQGAERTAYTLESECRELGLSVALLDSSATVNVDVAGILEECLSAAAWKKQL